MVRFSEWKRRTMQKLIQLATQASSEKERRDLENLMDMLYTLRYRDLSSFLRLLYEYCRYHNKFSVCKELTQEEIESD